MFWINLRRIENRFRGAYNKKNDINMFSLLLKSIKNIKIYSILKLQKKNKIRQQKKAENVQIILSFTKFTIPIHENRATFYEPSTF